MRWFSISGSASRKDAAAICALAWVLSLAVWLLTRSDQLWPWAPWLVPFAGIAWAAAIATLIRRLHDIGRSGAWVLLILITLPWLGLLLMLALIWQRPARRSHQPSLMGAVLGGTLIGLVVLVGLLGLFWRPMWLTSGDMKPGLLIGDRLLVRYGGAEDLSRGDLVLLRHPVSGVETVARVIGFAGERIEVQSGKVLLDGEALPQKPAGSFTEAYGPQGPRHILPRCRIEVGLSAACSADRAIETLPNGRRYAVLDHETRPGPPDTLPLQTVPEGHIYLLGDNRDAAIDSRFAPAAGGLGMVPLDRIVGTVDLIVFSSPANRPIYFWSWRPERLLARLDRLEAE